MHTNAQLKQQQSNPNQDHQILFVHSSLDPFIHPTFKLFFQLQTHQKHHPPNTLWDSHLCRSIGMVSWGSCPVRYVAPVPQADRAFCTNPKLFEDPKLLKPRPVEALGPGRPTGLPHQSGSGPRPEELDQPAAG